jgi:hypothetical protein
MLIFRFQYGSVYAGHLIGESTTGAMISGSGSKQPPKQGGFYILSEGSVNKNTLKSGEQKPDI